MSNNYMTENPQGGNRQRKEIINQWQGVGILRARSKDENEPLKFIPWKSGGGVINAFLKVSEIYGTDENGNPKTVRNSIPVSIKTNKNITPQQLQSIVSGTKVRIVGRLKLESFESKKTNTMTSMLLVEAYVLEILEEPMRQVQQYPPQYPPQPQYYPGQPPYYPQQPYPQQPYPQQPQGQPQYYPGQPQGQGQPYYPGNPYPPQQPQGQPQPQQQPQPQGQPTPQWYTPSPEMNIDDLPPA